MSLQMIDNLVINSPDYAILSRRTKGNQKVAAMSPSYLTVPADALASINLNLRKHHHSLTSQHRYFHWRRPDFPSPQHPKPRHVFLSPHAAILQDVGATAFVLGGGYALVSSFDYLTNSNIISAKLSRKLVHIISGLLFVASWPLFSTSIEARYFASVAPLANCIRLVVHGLSLATDDGLIKSVTREGKPEELLRGPLYYVLILALCAVIFWRESPVGLLSVAMMSGGDGIADIMGRNFGTLKLPYNKSKSWAGSISMFVFGFLVSIGMLYYFSALGYCQLDWDITAKRVAIVSFIATVVESLPIADLIDDNISVPLVTLATAYFCFSL